MMIAAPPKSRMKRRSFTERQTITFYEKSSTNQRADNAHGRTIWIADAHRDDGKRFVARADEKLTAFLDLESAIQAAAC